MDQISSRNPEMMRCYQHGLQLMTVQKNHDYAHILFVQCVGREPSNLDYAEALLKNLRAKHSDRKRKQAFTLGSNRTLKKAKQAGDWTGVIRLGVDILKKNPWDVSTLRMLAEACAALHYNEVELLYLKQALDSDPRSADVNRHCGRSLARMGQFDQAIACWHRVESLKGKDEESARMISQLAEEKLRYPGGRPIAAHHKPIAKVEPSVEANEAPKLAELSLTARQLLECALAENPRNLSAYMELAELMAESHEFEDAENTLNRAQVACGDQPTISQKLTEVRRLLAQQLSDTAEIHRSNEEKNHREVFRLPWLELGLVSAGSVLAMQFYPPAVSAAWRVVDVRLWSRLTWLLANVAILIGLFAIRFAPEIREIWKGNRNQRAACRKR